MENPLTRREFLTAAGSLVLMGEAAETSAGEDGIPRRMLGKTGVQVPILGFGTAPAGIRRSLSIGAGLYNEAIDLGVNYFDTAPTHTGYGRAQAQLGQVVRKRRKEIFLVTKCHEAGGEAALRLLDRNLKELKTDYADLVYVHSLGDLDLDVAMGKNGILPALLKAKKEGRIRFVGLSGHHRPHKFLKVLAEFDIDVMMCAVNFADRYTYGFEEKIWPTAARKKVGLVAMKVFGGMNYKDPGMTNSIMPAEHLQSAFRYALSLPNVSLAVIGMATREELHRNVEWAKRFQPLTAKDKQALASVGRRLAASWGPHFGPVA